MLLRRYIILHFIAIDIEPPSDRIIFGLLWHVSKILDIYSLFCKFVDQLFFKDCRSTHRLALFDMRFSFHDRTELDQMLYAFDAIIILPEDELIIKPIVKEDIKRPTIVLGELSDRR